MSYNIIYPIGDTISQGAQIGPGQGIKSKGGRAVLNITNSDVIELIANGEIIWSAQHEAPMRTLSLCKQMATLSPTLLTGLPGPAVPLAHCGITVSLFRMTEILLLRAVIGLSGPPKLVEISIRYVRPQYRLLHECV